MLALLRKGENDKAVAEAKALVAAFGQRPGGAQSRGRRVRGSRAAGRGPRAVQRGAQAQAERSADAAQPRAARPCGRQDRRCRGQFPQGARGRSEEPARHAGHGRGRQRAGRPARKPRSGCRRPLRTTPSPSTRSWRWRSSTSARATSARRGRDRRRRRKKSPDNAALSNARGLAQLGANDVPGAIASFKQGDRAGAQGLRLRAQPRARPPREP